MEDKKGKRKGNKRAFPRLLTLEARHECVGKVTQSGWEEGGKEGKKGGGKILYTVLKTCRPQYWEA